MRKQQPGLWVCCISGLLLAAAQAAFAGPALPGDLQSKIDQSVRQVLDSTGVPSASIAVVRDGKLAYAHAYGNARLDPKTPATPDMRYSIGSISKQFTAAAILMLQQQGKLSLDDAVAKFFPGLTDAKQVTLRELLSHTSGYQDYWPQDYLMPPMKRATTPRQIMDQWAKKPLDFPPGSKWQYSNTNFVIAGAIVQKLTGQTPFQFLQAHVFAPLAMHDVYDSDLRALPATDARGYSRYALGPLRPSPKEGAGWMFGAGELAMTPSSLARWDIAMIDRNLLQPVSWHEMETEARLANGLGANYGLGVHVGSLDGHREISHDGEVMGFTAANMVFPDDHAAVVVLTNQDAVSASGVIARKIAQALFEVHDPDEARALARAQDIFAGLQKGKIDRPLFTADANSYFDATALGDYARSLAPLGKPIEFKQRAERLRGGMAMRAYTVTFPRTKLDITTYIQPDGKLEQYLVSPAG